MTILEALENLENRSCSLSESVESVRFFREHNHPEERIRKLLLDLDIPQNTEGFVYLSTVIFNRIHHEEEKRTLESLYCEMATNLKKEKQYIKNQIRHAIQIASKSIYFLSYTDRIGGGSFIQTQKFVDGIIDYYKLLEFLATK